MPAIPVTYPLVGPLHPGKTQCSGPNWNWLETANSSSIMRLYFNLGLPEIERVTWDVVWTPGKSGNAKARLIGYEYLKDSVDLEEIAVIQPPAGHDGPIPSENWEQVTAALQKYRLTNRERYLGVQFADDGVNPLTIYRSQLYIYWQI